MRDRFQMAKMSVLDLNVAALPVELHARFWAKVAIVEDPLACWLWTGALNSPADRGWLGTRRPVFRLLSTQQVVVYGHRFALALKLGCSMKDLEGFQACHARECTSPLCVRGEHLYRGTAEQNRDDRYPHLARLPMEVSDGL